MLETAGTPVTIHLRDYRPPDFVIDAVDLIVDLDEEGATVRARSTIRRNPDVPAHDRPLVLDGRDLETVSVRLNGAELALGTGYILGSESLTIAGVPAEFELDIETRITPRDNTALSGIYMSGGNFCSQCEPEGFRRITWFADRPDVMARYSTTIVADRQRYPVLLSNGNPTGSGDATGGRHWAKWVDPHPKPSYLFALVAGDLVAVSDHFTTRSGRDIPLAIWVRHGDEDRCEHAMASLKAAMAWDEDVFGLEYDLDVFNIVAVSDFNMGAMENKGLNIFNTRFVLAKRETATDDDYQGIERVVAHEYFHNWTGNRVTCRDWFQLSLKEGLTVFRDQEFMADRHGRAVRRIGDVRVLRGHQFPEDDGPLAHPVRPESFIEIDNFYTATVYEKGAELVRMLQTTLGPEVFRRGIARYIAENDNRAATVEDFVAAMEGVSGIDLKGFMRWYRQAGTPELSVDDRYDAGNATYHLTLSQIVRPTPGQDAKGAVPIPVALGLLGPDGSALAFRLAHENIASSETRTLLLTEARQTFILYEVGDAPVPSLLRGFSAPVRLTGLSLDRLKFLATHDSDKVARWDAGQELASRILLADVERIRAGAAPTLDPDLVEAFRRTLGDPDRAFVAEALRLPGESLLADRMTIVDVDAIHTARDHLRRGIGRALDDEFRAVYRAAGEDGPFRIDAEAMAARALSNLALSYLVASGAEGAVGLAKRQFDQATNMTDALAALAALNDLHVPEREAALDAFRRRWDGNDLVIDKWFSIQATSARADTIDRVMALADLDTFDRRNPNRVRSLVGAFAQGNPLHFHAASGRGYRFLTDHILAIDPLNPLLAARLMQPLGQWRRQDEPRQEAMRAALERILATKDLSRHSYEMASKSLV